MAINKIPNSYVNNNATWTPLKTVAIKLNETIDVVNDLNDGVVEFEEITVTDTITTDTIVEYTVAAGVTIDSLLIKDAGLTASGVATFSNAAGVTTNTITERTAAAGVTIDSVLLKDGGAVFADGATIEVDTVNEASTGVGVTIDTALIKDGTLLTAVGAVGTPAVQVGSADTGLYQVSGTQTGFSQDGVLVAGYDTNGLFAGVISEQVADAGVTIDNILLKDDLTTSNITDLSSEQTITAIKHFTNRINTDRISEETADNGIRIDDVKIKDTGVSNVAGTIFAGFYPLGVDQALSGAGAVNLTAYHTKFTSTATGNALTLAAGSNVGQMKKITYVAEGAGADTGVLSLTGYTSITFNAIADYAILMWNGTAWFVIENVGVTIV